MRATLVSLLLIMLCSQQVNAKSFGIVGEVFPVAEKSFLVLIAERLRALEASGQLQALNERWVNTVALHANRPTPLNLGRATYTSKHTYVPAITLSQDIAGSEGRLLYARGTQVNALEKLPSYQPCWLFFNADDEAELNWAERQKKGCSNPKFILTGGAVNVAEKRLGAPIYFDQAGRLSRQLNIAHVPAMVTREGNKLVICEQAIKENGDVL
jgi:conjugal transfer pilus assembly protein TraW